MMGFEILRRQLKGLPEQPPAFAGGKPGEGPAPAAQLEQPWLADKMKEFLGIDFEQMKRFGDDIGQLLGEFRTSLVRIEARLEAIEARLPAVGYDRAATLAAAKKAGHAESK